MNAPLPEPEKPQFITEADQSQGVSSTGGKCGWELLSIEDVAAIRASDLRNIDLAERYRVSEPTISRIRRNERHRDPLFTPPSRTKTSEVTGVFWHRPSQRWRVQFQRKGKRHYLGDFKVEETAIEVAERFQRETAPTPTRKVAAAAPPDELRAWVNRRKREMAGEPLTRADKEQLRRHLEDL